MPREKLLAVLELLHNSFFLFLSICFIIYQYSFMFEMYFVKNIIEFENVIGNACSNSADRNRLVIDFF